LALPQVKHIHGHLRRIVLGHEVTYVVEQEMKGKMCYTESEVICMLEFLIDNIFVKFEGHIFRQVIGIPMGTISVLLLVDFNLYSYEAEKTYQRQTNYRS